MRRSEIQLRYLLPLVALVALILAAPSHAAPSTATQVKVLKRQLAAARAELRKERRRASTLTATRAQAQRKFVYADQQLRVAIGERDAARRDLATVTGERDTAHADAAAVRVAMSQQLEQQVASLTNDQIWELVWKLVIAFDKDCRYSDSTFVSLSFSTVTFERTYGLC